MRFRIAFKALLVFVILLTAQSSFVSAEEDSSPQKRVAIAKLIESFEMSRHTASIFEELTTLYQENWTVTVVANLKEKGLFKRYTPQQAARVEKVINEFSGDMFDEIRKRMRAQVFTPESLENVIGPTFNKYLSEAEINELVAFSQSSSSRKLIDTYYKLITEATVMRFKERGFFEIQSSPASEEAKLAKLKRESENSPLADINKILSTTQQLAAETYTQSEKLELSALANKPFGVKLRQILPSMAVEIQANSTRLYGQQVEKLTQEVIDEQLKTLDRRVSEALKQ